MSNIISIIIPTYKCAPFIEEICERCQHSINFPYEIIFVNDNSPMNDWDLIEKVCSVYNNVKGINLSRNFGQHHAIYAGLKHASGDWIVVMDGDLQDQPEEITKLYNKAQEGYDIVYAKRFERKDSFLKKLGSKYFYKVLAYLTETEQNSEIANFGIYHRNVINSILEMNDHVRYFPTMVRWVGYKYCSINVEHAIRDDGGTGYNFKRLLLLALNVILSFSDKPLRLTVKLGLFISAFSILSVIFFLYRYINGDIKVLGYSSIIISIWFLSGIIITIIGVVGLYIGRIFDQVKDRPKFIINKKINFND